MHHPNPNPTPIYHYDDPLASYAAAPGVFRPPEVAAYVHDPYASRLADDGPTSVAAQSYAECYYQEQQAPPAPPQLQQYPSFTYGLAGTGSTTADLESKKQKMIAGGAEPSSVRVCSVCNVVCNSDLVFARHLAGEKHSLKTSGVSSRALKPKVPHYATTKKAPAAAAAAAKKAVSKGLITFVQSSYCVICKINCNSQEAFNIHRFGKKHIKNLQKLEAAKNPKPASASNASTTVAATSIASEAAASLYCGVCKTSCNSQEMLNSHMLGKKHIKNLHKLKEDKDRKPAAAPGASKAVDEQSMREELHAKKQKVVGEGAAADAVRVCAPCSVVCNSETVYKFHVAGKKHAAVMNKLKEAESGQPKPDS